MTETPAKLPPAERIKNYNEFESLYSDEELNKQSARCMNCGIPFAIVVARWVTSYRSLMMPFIIKTGKRLIRSYHQPITS